MTSELSRVSEVRKKRQESRSRSKEVRLKMSEHTIHKKSLKILKDKQRSTKHTHKIKD